MRNTKIREIRKRRIKRTRAKIFGTAERPRLAVFRSNRHLYLQLINDIEGKTLAAASTEGLEGKSKEIKKSDLAALAGETLAKKAAEMRIQSAVFDRRAYKYHGRVKAAAEAARKGGLKF
ncbi:MAG: 50S ribosomal protein L18 [Candidatus Colwellbacteria bacterium]|nr:50S ribosomal protein L18 [Candidatus Colwellbacteria bacterium]